MVTIQAFSVYFGTGRTYRVRTLSGARRVLRTSPGEGWGYRLRGTEAQLLALDPTAYALVTGDWMLPALDRTAEVSL